MHRAKGDRFVRASERPVCDNAEADARYMRVVALYINPSSASYNLQQTKVSKDH